MTADGRGCNVHARQTGESDSVTAGYTCTVTQVRTRRPTSPAEASACCGPIDDLLDPALFKALCDPTRAKLLACLVKCGRPCSVGEVAACCSVDLSVVSRHLRTLEAAGVLTSVKSGRMVSYEVRWEPLSGVLRDLADAIAGCGPSTRCVPCKGACRVRR